MKHDLLRPAAAVTAALLSVGACAPANVPDAISANAPRISIDLYALPDTLPASVGAVAIGVVKLNVEHSSDKADQPANSASGYRISSTEILTAGHALYNGDGSPKSGVELCNQIRITGLQRMGRSTTGNAPTMDSFSADATTFAGSYADQPGRLDAALLRTPPEELPTLPNAKIRTTPVLPGEPVYFITFQPGHGAQRDPTAIRDPLRTIPIEMAYPAIYGGIALGVQGKNVLRVATNLKSYGKASETFAVIGASGGAVVDGQGGLIGVVARADLRESLAQTISLDYGVSIADNQKSGIIRSAYVQLTTAAVIGDLRQTLSSARACSAAK